MKNLKIARVGIDARFVIDWDHPHGALLRELLKANEQEKHPVHYYLFHVQQLLTPQPWLKCSNVTTVLVNCHGSSERWAYWRFFDSAICSFHLDLFLSPFYRIPLRAWLAGTPMLHMIHDVSPLTVPPDLLPERFQSPWKRFQILVGFWVYARIAKRTISVSEHAAMEIRQVLSMPRSRLAVVPNCFSADLVRENSESTPVNPYLLFIGVNMPKKNLQGLLNAWPIIRERFPHSQLVVRSNLTTEEQASCPEGVVVQGERLEQSVLHSLIRNASALVLPSFHEGFGLPVLEAMTLGTPVCVSRGTALEEVAGEGALLFNPASADSIAATCCEVLGFTPSQREEQRQRSRRQAEQFLPTRIIPQLLRLIQQTARNQ